MAAAAVKRALPLCAAIALAACASVRTAFLGADPLAEPRALFDAGEYEKVIALLPESRIPKLPRRYRGEAYHWLGQSYDRRKKSAKALQLYQLGAGLFPKDLKLLTNLANILNRVGLHDRARPHFERVLDIHPNNASAHLGLADIYRKQGYLAKALGHFHKTLEQWSDNPYIWRDYAEALADAGRLEEASEAILAAKGHKIDSAILAVEARIARLRGRHDDAYTSLSAAIAAEPAGTDLLLEKAVWLLEDERLDETFGIAGRVIGEDPEEPLAHWLRAVVHLRNGRTADARADLNISAAAFRSHPFIAKTAGSMLQELDRPQ